MKKGAVSNANFRAFETAPFLFICKGNERKRKTPPKEAKKRIVKILVFKIVFGCEESS